MCEVADRADGFKTHEEAAAHYMTQVGLLRLAAEAVIDPARGDTQASALYRLEEVLRGYPNTAFSPTPTERGAK